MIEIIKILHTGDTKYLTGSDSSFNPKKNPAYGRQSISRPMRIVAPITQ